MTVVWRQWIEGFDSTTAEVGCTATVDTAAGGRDKNKLTATIASASDTADQATGNVTTAAWLPSNDQGRLRFKFRAPAALPLAANSTICRIYNPAGAAGVVIDLYVLSRLNCFSAANTLRAASINQLGITNLVADTEYTAEAAWKGATDATGFVRFWLNDILQFETTSLDMVTVNDCDAASMTLGIDHYDGASPTGWSTVIRWAQLSDDPTEVLVDPADAIPGSISVMAAIGY